MRRHTLMMLTLALAAAQPVSGGTFRSAPIAPDLGVQSLTRSVSRELVNRDLFADPYSTVTISHVDVYDRFPYVESRHFEIVSDPAWNRIVYGERGQSLKAFDVAGGLGALKQPRGLAVDENDRVYVADAGNDRVLVLQASTEHGDITLSPAFAIPNVGAPQDVAYSDGGTPFVGGDDVLIVAETGKNRVVAYALDAAGAREIASIGELGSGAGRFAGPMAVAVGRSGAGSSPDVYVADAHNGRIAHLRLEGGAFRWDGEAVAGADVVTSLDTDAWGNVYAAAPRAGLVKKFNPALEPVAEMSAGLARPKSLHVPFTNVRDHRSGTLARVGQPSALTVSDWSDQSGIAMWDLGLELTHFEVAGTSEPELRFELTDRAEIAIDVTDATTGRALSRRTVGTLDAGAHAVPLTAADLAGADPASDFLVRVRAASSYENGPATSASTTFHFAGGVVSGPPSRPMLLGNTPNPANPWTRISFVLPNEVHGKLALRVFDAQGRVVRTLRPAFAPGFNETTWDGRDDAGRGVKAGVYFARLDAGEDSFANRIVVVQ